MIGRFLSWIALTRSRPLRSRTPHSTATNQRRLAIEPVENRMLLSATGTETIADGGSVWFGSSSGYAFTASDTRDLVQPASDSEFTIDTHARYQSNEVTGVISGDFLLSNERVALPEIGNTERSQLLDNVSGFDDISTFTSPKSEELTQEELPLPEVDAAKNETGLADVALIARREVFAEIGSRGQNLHLDDRTDARSSVQLADAGSPAAILNAAADSCKTVESLAGSRGRLAAFDLAMREETADLPLPFETVERDESFSNSRAAADDSHSSQPNPGTSAAIMNIECGRAQATRDRELRLHDVALTDIAESQTIAAIAVSEAPNSSERAWKDMPHVQGRPQTHYPINTHAVYLDQKHARPVATLATVVGAAYVLNGNRRFAGEDSEHEQLPPRDKRKRLR